MKYLLTYKQYRHGSLGCLILYGICTLVLVLFLLGSWDSIWEGYYTLAIEDSLGLPAVHNLLQELSASEIISAQSALVKVQSFSDVEYIAVQEIPKRLDVQDPRYTDYLRNVGNYFTTSDNDGNTYHLVYIRDEQPVIFLYTQLWQLLNAHEARWVLADISLSFRIWLLVLFVGMALLTQYVLYGKFRLLLVIAIVPAMLLTAMGSLATFVLASIWYISYMRLLVIMSDLQIQDKREIRKARLRSAAQCIIVTLLCLITLLINRNFSLLPMFSFVLLAWAFLVGFRYLKDIEENLKQEHKVFRFMPIVTEKQVPIQVYFPERIIPSLLIHLSLIMFLFLPRLQVDVGISIPRRKQPASIDAGWYQQIQTLWDARTDDALPNISDYLAHTAFQDSLLFRKDYDYYLPKLGETIVVSHYEQVQGSIEQQKRVAFTFDMQWFQNNLEASLWPSVSNLLVLQSVFTIVAKEEEHTTRDFPERFILLIVASAVPLLLSLGDNRKAAAYEDVFLV